MLPAVGSSSSSLGTKAAKRHRLALRLSTDVDFGVVKLGKVYRLSTVLTNVSCTGLRWRIDAKEVTCVTPRGRLGPGVSIRVDFEFSAATLGTLTGMVILAGKEDDSIGAPRICRLEVPFRAVVVDPMAFQAHVCRMRYLGQPLLNTGVRRSGDLRRPQRPSSRRVIDADDDADDDPDDATEDEPG